jgi:hypothetical protein
VADTKTAHRHRRINALLKGGHEAVSLGPLDLIDVPDPGLLVVVVRT